MALDASVPPASPPATTGGTAGQSPAGVPVSPPVAPPTPPAVPPAGTVLDLPSDDIAPPTQQNWPDDWREKYSKGDAKKLGVLQRYASFDAALDGLFASKQRISEGPKPLSANATPEQINAWRKDNGIPEKSDGYEIKLSEGRKISDEDKPFVDKLTERLHGLHTKPEVVSAAVDAYYDIQDMVEDQEYQADAKIKQSTEDNLRADWGGDYRRNVQFVHALLAQAGTETRDLIAQARLSDGTPLASHSGVLKFLAKVARELNPIATVVPNAGGNAAGAIADEVAAFEKMMGDHSSEYWKGPKAESNQQRYRDLISARDRIAVR